MTGKIIYSVCLLLILPFVAMETGCSPLPEDVSEALTKTMQKSGCQGCRSEEVEGELEGEQEGETEGETEGESRQYTLMYLAGPNGSLSGETTQTILENGSGTPVKAEPDAGYRFLQWSDGSLTALRHDLNVTEDITVTALFIVDVAMPRYTLTYLAGEGGKIQGPAVQVVERGSDGTAVTARPAPGYEFLQWDDGLETKKRKDSGVMADMTVTAIFITSPLPWIDTFKINNGETWTTNPVLTLNNTYIGSEPAEYMASEDPYFRDADAEWLPYSGNPTFTVSGSAITRTVYFKLRNAAGEHETGHDSIILAPQLVPVDAGAFTMGRRDDGDDGLFGENEELPRHAVTLDAYQIGKYEITNRQYCDVLNWAFEQGYLYRDIFGTPWQGLVNIYAGGGAVKTVILNYYSPNCNIKFNPEINRFEPKKRTGASGGIAHSMAEHPVVEVSWYGAAAFCNWLSEMIGLTPCYAMEMLEWPLVASSLAGAGFRLPSEAEWERAAAWDGTKHWIYSFASDELDGEKRCNYRTESGHVNPLGLTTEPFTAPVGWFNGINTSPQTSISTTNSPSPVGAYDMSGNVAEWCQDWYAVYSDEAQFNPLGPASGTDRVRRGGGWNTSEKYCRTADRRQHPPTETYYSLGFRVARTP